MRMHDLATDLPPHPQTPAAWHGPDMGSRTDWIEHLPDAELGALETAASRPSASDAELAQPYPPSPSPSCITPPA